MSETSSAPPPAPRSGVPVWAQIIIWGALLALLTLVALGLRRTQQKPIQIGDSLPEFPLVFFEGYKLQDKTEVNLSSLKGKVVVINFWASWCKPCEQEAAELEAAWRFYEPGGQVVFIGVDYVDTEPEARGYLKKFEITYPNGPDLGTRISQMFRITGVPETYFVDKDGKLAYAQIGPFTTEAEIHAIVDPLIKK